MGAFLEDGMGEAARTDAEIAGFHSKSYRRHAQFRDTSETLRDTSEALPRHFRDTSETLPRRFVDTS